MIDLRQIIGFALRHGKVVFLLTLVPIFFYLLFFPFQINALLYLLLSAIFISITTAFYFGRSYYSGVGELNENIERVFAKEIDSAKDFPLSADNEIYRKNLKKIIKELRIQEEKLSRLTKARSQFLGNVSHELRTPIFAIQGYIETLLNGAIDDEAVNRTFLIKANKHLNNLNLLLNDLIDISMIEAGEMLMSYRYFNLKEFLEGVVDTMIPYVEQSGKNLEIEDIPEDLEVVGDIERLKGVMFNLISNAVKYNNRDLIKLRVNDKRKKVEIIVKDNGLGIPEDEISRIFERFYRTERDKNSKISGSGLGLSIAKHIVEAHGSKLKVKSKLGEGSEFSFELKK